MLDQGYSGRLGQAELATADIEQAVGLVTAELLEQSERLQIDLQRVDDPNHWVAYSNNMVAFPTPRPAVGGVARLLLTLAQNVIQPPLGPYTTPQTKDALTVVVERLNNILTTLGFTGDGPTGPGFDTYADTFTDPSREVIRTAEELVVTQEAPGIDVWEPSEVPGTIPGEEKGVGLLVIGGLAAAVGILVAVLR